MLRKSRVLLALRFENGGQNSAGKEHLGHHSGNAGIASLNPSGKTTAQRKKTTSEFRVGLPTCRPIRTRGTTQSPQVTRRNKEQPSLRRANRRHRFARGGFGDFDAHFRWKRDAVSVRGHLGEDGDGSFR